MVASKAKEGDLVCLKITLEKQATRVLDNKTQMLEILCQCIISMVVKICTAIFNVR